MKTRKHIWTAVLALTGAALLILAACGPKAPQAEPTPSPTAEAESTPSAEAVLPQATPTPTAAADPMPTEPLTVATPPVVGSQNTAQPSESKAPVQSQPIETPPASSQEQSKVQAVWTAIEKRDLPYFEDLDDELLADFYGVDPADLVEYVCKIPFMNTQATEFFIAQVQPDRMDAVKAALEKRQADLLEQWKQYLPDQLELVENYKLATNGDYILFAVTEYADDVVNDFNAYTK